MKKDLLKSDFILMFITSEFLNEIFHLLTSDYQETYKFFVGVDFQFLIQITNSQIIRIKIRECSKEAH